MASSQLRGILDRYTNENVRIKRESKTAALRVWEEPVRRILDKVASRDIRFQIQEVVASGSFYERLKVKEPDEFDLTLVMKRLQCIQMQRYQMPPGFTTIICQNAELWKNNGCLSLPGNQINANQVKAVFCEQVRKAVEELHLMRNISVQSQGPAVTLKVSSPSSFKVYSIDLTLAVKISSWPDVAEEWRMRPRNGWPSQQLVSQICRQGCHVVAKQPKPTYFGREEDRKMLWRFSFSEAEKTLFREGSQGQASSCRKQVLRILKALRLDLNMGPLKSYHLKTIMLYECEAYPRHYDWSHDKLQDRFDSAIMRLLNCLRQRNCPHYFIKSLNLFESFGNCTQLIRTVQELATNPSQKIEQILRRYANK